MLGIFYLVFCNVDSEGHIKLADFGLAKDQILGPNQAKSFCGSPAYLPP